MHAAAVSNTNTSGINSTSTLSAAAQTGATKNSSGDFKALLLLIQSQGNDSGSGVQDALAMLLQNMQTQSGAAHHHHHHHHHHAGGAQAAAAHTPQPPAAAPACTSPPDFQALRADLRLRHCRRSAAHSCIENCRRSRKAAAFARAQDR